MSKNAFQLQINHCINIVNKYDDYAVSIEKFEFSHIDRNIQRIRKDHKSEAVVPHLKS